jgi:hypothetical protein
VIRQTVQRVVLAICSLLIGGLFLGKRMTNDPGISTITTYHPYGPIFPMDPRAIDSVGDQVLSEHLFGFHSRASTRDGFAPVLSKVEIARSDKTIRITLQYPLHRSDGTEVSSTDVCNSIRESFQGTSHVPYSSLLGSISCTDRTVSIQLTKIPVNIEFLFTLPDFSIYDKTTLPVTSAGHSPTTGPYVLVSSNSNEVILGRNRFYPPKLVANQIDRVSLRSYSSSDTEQFVRKLEPTKDHFAYFFGHVLSEASKALLKEKGYRLNLYPSEWLIYLGFQPEVKIEDRKIVASYLDRIRAELLSIAPAGQLAYSIAPSERPWALDERGYKNLVGQSDTERLSLSRPLTLGTLDHWAEIPLFKAVLTKLSHRFPNLRLKIYPRAQGLNFYSSCDLFLTPIGISPADPLSHLSFLKSFYRIYKDVLTDERLTGLATENDPRAFAENVKQVESEIATKRLMVPLAHFPGIVAESPLFEKDESLTWSWGIQPWTYRLR